MLAFKMQYIGVTKNALKFAVLTYDGTPNYYFFNKDK